MDSAGVDRWSADDPPSPHARYGAAMAATRAAFGANQDGLAAVRSRAAAVDTLLRELWTMETTADPHVGRGVALVALGGYGRSELYPYSDVDLLFCTAKNPSDATRAAVRRVSQALWDCGLRISVTTQALGDCERFKPGDPEGALALLDMRLVDGDGTVYEALRAKILDRRSARDSRTLAAALAELTQARHGRFGQTIFHLEPNVKDAPGGLRDTHARGWFNRLAEKPPTDAVPEAFAEAVRFLTTVRVFLHERHGRDDNTLDWHMEDEAAALGIGLDPPAAGNSAPADAAYWMRSYFRHARAVVRELAAGQSRAGQQPKLPRSVLRTKAPPRSGFTVENGVIDLKQPRPELDPAHDPEIVLGAFALIAAAGVSLSVLAEDRITDGLPALSTNLEDGPELWTRFRPILVGAHAGKALRSMHAVGVLELLLPEFHGIDALVVRDAYHRYTVDEHTFVLIDALHDLRDELPPAGKGASAPEWRARLRSTLLDLPQPELLYLAALLHDTGKGRASTQHASVSARLAESVCLRLELEPYDRSLVVRLIECHLEMSAALRRDIFDNETVRVFAEKVQTHDLLRLLTLFTFADISAVHPDALTPWKAENLWRLSMATANQLDRSVDEDRVGNGTLDSAREPEALARALGLSTAERADLTFFLEGLPERYLHSHSAESIRQHLRLANPATPLPVLLRRQSGETFELTVVTGDRPALFADLTGVLSAWGMNIMTAEAFSNAHGTVVDTFRFTDSYRTLELNPEEGVRLTGELHGVIRGTLSVEKLLSGRRRTRTRRARRIIETRIECSNTASSRSTLLQIVTEDVPGLLRAISLTLNAFGCSVEVALIDTEGDMAIDVFYVTGPDGKLTEEQQGRLADQLTGSLTHNLG